MKKIKAKRKKIKCNINKIRLNIDYKSINKNDIYGFYLTCKTTKNNVKELPDIGNFASSYPNYFVLDKECRLYHNNPKACVCFFQDDKTFDTIDGLYNAIIYKNRMLLKYYKKRYENINYFIPIDFSTYGDFPEDLVLYNIKRQCIVYLWFVFECDGIVFPLMTYGSEKTLTWCFEHIMFNSNVCVSLKGVMTGPDRELFKKALKVLIDTRKPKCLLVYTVASKKTSDEILKYAIDNNVDIKYINNTLLSRNCKGDFYGA